MYCLTHTHLHTSVHIHLSYLLTSSDTTHDAHTHTITLHLHFDPVVGGRLNRLPQGVKLIKIVEREVSLLNPTALNGLKTALFHNKVCAVSPVRP